MEKNWGNIGMDTSLSPILYNIADLVHHGKALGKKQLLDIGLIIVLWPIAFQSLSLVLNLWALLSDSQYLP